MSNDTGLHACPKCAKATSDFARFCQHCGSPQTGATLRNCVQCGSLLIDDGPCLKCQEQVKTTYQQATMDLASGVCSSCGANLVAGKRFCGQCGKQQDANLIPPHLLLKKVKRPFCPRCGTNPDEGAMFCPGCGGKFRKPIGPPIFEYETQAEYQQRMDAHRQSSQTTMWVIIVICAVICSVVGMIWLMTYR